MSYQVWYVACHFFLHIYAIFICHMSAVMYIVLSFVFDMLKFLHAMSISCCMTIDVSVVKICTCCITYSFMLHQDFHFWCIAFSHFCCNNNKKSYCINTTNLCCMKICQLFQFFDHSIQWEAIISLEHLVAFGPTTLQNLNLQDTITRKSPQFFCPYRDT